MPRPPTKPRLAVRSATVAKYLPDAEAPADPNAPIAPSSLLTDQYILNAERSASCALLRLTLLSLLLYFVAGAAVFTYLEDDWSPPEALWFLAQTLSTVGYGDIVPATKVGKLAASVWSLAGVAFTAMTAVVIGDWMAPAQVDRSAALPDDERPRRPCIGPACCTFGYLVFVILVGSVFFMVQEDKHLDTVDAVYLAVTTLCTVGYGDYAARSTYGKVFTIVYILAGLLVLIKAVSIFVASFTVTNRERAMRQVLADRVDASVGKIVEMDNREVLSKAEFTLFKMIKLGLVHPTDVQTLENQFDELDLNHDGELSPEELGLVLR